MPPLVVSLSINMHKTVRHKILPSARLGSAEIYPEILSNPLESIVIFLKLF